MGIPLRLTLISLSKAKFGITLIVSDKLAFKNTISFINYLFTVNSILFLEFKEKVIIWCDHESVLSEKKNNDNLSNF